MVNVEKVYVVATRATIEIIKIDVHDLPILIVKRISDIGNLIFQRNAVHILP